VSVTGVVNTAASPLKGEDTNRKCWT